MPRISQRIFYDLLNGKVLRSIGERQGDVRSTTYQEDFPEYDETLHGVIELRYGDGRLHNVGSYKVDIETRELIIYPKIHIETDKKEIIADGVDVSVITARISDNDYKGNTIFSIDGEEVIEVPFNLNEYPYEVQVTNEATGETKIVTKTMSLNEAKFEFVSDIEGIFGVEVSNELFGTNSLEIEVVENAEISS